MTTAGWRLPGYAVDRLIGVGGDGDVWQGHLTATGEAVALKRIRALTAERARTARAEAAMLATLDHPNLLRLRELLVTGDAIVLVLDLAAAGSLGSLVAARGRLTPGEVIAVLAPVAAALAHVHAAGVVHGDVTPGNVLLTDLGLPLLADLGVARIVGDGTTVHTTPAFVEPTVAAGHLPGVDSDVFMLGGVALHALTGSGPWPGDTPEQMRAAAAARQLGDVDARLADVPGAIAEVVRRALALDPRQRGTAAEFALDLRHAGEPTAVELWAGRARERPVLASPDPAEGEPRQGGRHQARPVKEKGSRQRRRLTAAAGPSTDSGADLLAAGRPAFVRPGQATPDGSPPTNAAPLTVGARPRALAVRPPVRRWHRRRGVRAGCVALLVLAIFVLGVLGRGVTGWSVHPAGRGAARAVPAGVPGGDRAAVAAHSSAPSPAPRAARSATASVTGAPSRAPTQQSRSPVAMAAAELSRLDAIRGRAFAARAPSLLGQVYATAALRQQDIATLDRVVPAGCGLHGVRTSFTQVTAVPAGAGLRVTAVVRLAPSILRCGATVRGTAPADGPVRLQMTLVPRGGGLVIAAQSRA